MIDPISLTLGPNGPRVINLIVGIGGVVALCYRKKLVWWEWISFIAFAYYLHETITQGVEWSVRYLQGFQSVVSNVVWTNATGGGFEIAAAFLIIGGYAFRKRLKLSPFVATFIAANVIWLVLGYQTSPAIYKTLPSSTSDLTNFLEECYTGTFMLTLWASFK